MATAAIHQKKCHSACLKNGRIRSELILPQKTVAASRTATTRAKGTNQKVSGSNPDGRTILLSMIPQYDEWLLS